MILSKIILNNFLSHKETEIEFKDNQNVLIDGVSGSGKSSIIEALCFCLYGTARSDNKSLIRRKMATANVAVVLKDEKKNLEYRIERIISNKGKHELNLLTKEGDGQFKMSATGVKTTQEYIERDILKSSYLLFVNSIVHLQENLNSFVKQTAAKRKDILLEIINASSYDEYLKKTKEKLQEYKTSTAVTASKIEALVKSINANKLASVSLDFYREKDKRLRDNLEKTIAIKTETEEKIRQLDKNKVLMDVAANVLNEERQKLNNINRQLAELDSQINKANDDLQIRRLEDLETLEAELADLEGKQSQILIWNQKMLELAQDYPADPQWLDAHIEELNKEIIQLLSSKIEECPELGKICPVLKQKNDSRVTELTASLDAATGEKQAQEKRLKEYQDKILELGPQPQSRLTEIDELKQAIKDKKLLEKFNELLKEAEIINKNIQIREAEIDEFKESREALLSHQERLEALVQEEKNFNADILENYTLLKLAELAKEEEEKETQELETIKESIKKSEEDVLNLELLKDAFGSNGIKSIVIDHIIPQLEDKINNILGKLSDFRIRLETQKNGVGKDVVLEGLFITIIDGQNEEMDFASLSGGEKLKVTMAISEALSEVQNISFRILDEAFIGLDDDSIDSFTKVMLTLQERFKQMICVSHLRNIKDLFDERILVKKTNGVSTIAK